ncbi:MAG: PKD domain-containing protein [Candidatus Aenigmarchaeota archaeon]|nr:PKD domain-containing protein [Candidatus Aenigmarchaeota archaeon]
MSFKQMNGSLKSRFIIVLVAVLVISLSVSAFAFSFTTVLNSNTPFQTTILKCTDATCSAYADSGTIYSSGSSNSLQYTTTDAGSYVEFDYATCKRPKIIIADFTGAETGSIAYDIPFSIHSNRNATINSLSPSTTSTSENTAVTVTANIKAALGYPSDPVPIPSALQDAYSYTTDVTFTVKKDGVNFGSPQVIQVSPLIASNADAVFSFTPTQQGTYIVDVKSKVTDCQVDPSTSTELQASPLTIAVSDTAPTGVDFSADKQSGIEPVTVAFTPSSSISGSDIPFTYSWNFGDGATRTEQSPTYTYPNNGKYNVTLTVTDSDGSPVSIAKTDFISVSDAGQPTANFQATPLSGTEPLSVQFTDFSQSVDGVTQWLWDFGDGQTSSEKNPTHTFAQNKTYTVSLVVKEADGGTSNSFTRTITVSDTVPTGLDFSPTTATEDQSTTFTATTPSGQDTPFTYSWNFNSEETKTGQSASTTFKTPGSKTVTLTVTDADGSVNTTTKTVDVNAVNDAPVIIASLATPLESEDFTNPITVDLTSLESDEEDGPAADGNGLVWSVSGVDTSLLSASLNQATDVLTINSVPQASGTNTLTLTLTDSDGKTATTQFTITVSPINDDPTSTSIPNQQWDEDTVKTINLLDYFSDVEGPFQSILPVSQPANIQVTVSNFVATLTPNPDFNSNGGQTRTVQFIATDKGQPDGVDVKTKTSNVITLTVNPVNEISSDSTISSGSTVNEFSTVSGGSTISGTSIVVNSTVSSSTVQSSNLQNSSLSQGSVAQNSVLKNVVLINSTVIETNLENVTLVNSFVDPSNVKNSVIQDSTVINSNITDSTITKSRTENMTVTSATVTDNVLQSGTIVYLGETYSTPSTTLAYIKDRPPVSIQTFNGVFWLEDASNTADLSTEFFDSDGDTLSYSASSVQNIQISISQTGIVTFTPDANFTGQRQVIFSATDPIGKSVNGDFVVNLTVLPQNDNPEIISTAITTATEDSAYSYDVNAFDVDADTLTFSLITFPTSMTVNPSTGVISWTPVNSQVGSNSITVQVTDGTLTNTQSFTITVTNTNDAPTTSAIPIQTWPEDTTSPVLNLSQFFSDVDVGDTLTFSVVTSPVNVVVNQNNNLITFTPSANFTGLNSVKFRATDLSGDFVESNLVSLNITPVNDPPVISVTQPNGGELWNGIKQITWTSADVDQNTLTVDLSYSTDGIAWNTIAELASAPAGEGTYEWDTSALSGITFLVRITVNDGAESVSDDSNAVFTLDNAPPSVDIVGSLSLTESATPVQYNSTTSDNIAGVDSTSFFWTFGDGTNATGSSVNHAYGQNGTFQLTVLVKDNLGNQNSSTKTVVVNDTLPTSIFAFNPSTGLQEGVTQINFTTTSSAYDQPIILFWDFGDGTNSTDLAPTKIYNQNKTYTATLTVTDSDGSQTQSQQAVTVDDLGPVASFTFTPTSNIFENTTQVNFTDQSGFVIDQLATYLWDFGDGTISTLQNPTHTFVFNNTYQVRLNVTDSDGTTASFAQIITVLDNSPNIIGGEGPLTINEGELATYTTDASSDPDTIVKYEWDFNYNGTFTVDLDSGLVNSANTTFNANGTYLVATRVTDSDDSISLFNSPFITVNDKAPSVDFTFSPSNPDEDQTITFTDITTTASDSIISYSWNFGDSATATTQNATHSYIAGGAFQVTLTVVDSDGSTNSTTKTVTVNPINDAPEFNLSAPLPNVNFDEDTTGTVNLAPSFFDIDNSDLNWTSNSDDITNITVNINQDTGIVTFIPDQNFAGSRQINFTATDGLLNSNQSNTVTVTVNAVNDAPNSPIIPTQNWIEDNQQDLNLSQFFSDIDNSTLVYSVVLSPVNVTPVIAGEIVTFTPSANFTGLNTVQFSASDGSLVNNSNIININVTPVNDEPILSLSVPDIGLDEDLYNDTLSNLNTFFTDVDSPLAFTAVSDNPSILVNITGYSVNLTAIANFNGQGNVTFTASDGEFNVTDTISVLVNSVNDNPVVSALSITGSNSTGFFKGNLTLSATASDTIDGSVVDIQFERSLNSTNGVDGAFTNIGNSTTTLVWNSEPLSGTDSAVWVRARALDNDGGLSSYLTQQIKVDNQGPVTSHNYDNSYKSSPFTITLTANDFSGSGVTSNNIRYRINGGTEQSVGANGQPVISTESPTNYLEFYSIDRLAHQESLNNLTSIKLDLFDPITADNSTPNWLNTSFTLELTATDGNGSGIDSTVYCTYTTTPCDLDTEGNFYTAPFTISANGITNISYRSTDNVNRVEATKTAVVKVDKIKPVISENGIVIYDNYVRNNTIVNVSVTVTDSLSGVSTVTAKGTSLVNQGNGIWQGPVTLNFDGSLPAVNIPLNVVVTDVAGNVETNNSEVFHIDNDSPVINSVLVSDNVTQNNTPVTVTVNITESGPLVPGSVTAEGVALTGGPEIFTGTINLVSGNSPVDIFVMDEAGNNATDTSATFLIDDTVPITSDNAPASWQISGFNVTLTATDLESGVNKTTYSLDGGLPIVVSSSTTNVEILTDGNHTIVYNATNNADGVSSTKTISAALDRVNPSISFASGPANGTVVKDGTPPISVLSSDSTSGLVNITVFLDGLQEFSCASSPCSEPWSSTNGQHTLNATATDSAGLQNSTETRAFIVDNVAPIVSLVGPANNTLSNQSTHSFQFNATDNVFSTLSCTVFVNGTASGTNSSVVAGEITTINSAVPEGTNGWYVSCTDGSSPGGNTGSSESFVLTTDYTAPDVTVSLSGHNNLVIAPKSTTSAYNTLGMIFTATEPVNWSSVSNPSVRIFNSTGDQQQTFHGSNLVNLSITKSWGNGDIGAELTEDGLHSINVTVKDLAGNVLTKQVGTFQVDNTAPVLDTLSFTPIPVEGVQNEYDGTGLVIPAYNISWTDNIAGVDSSSFVWNFGDATPVQTGPTVNHTYAQNGTYTLTIFVNDTVGNQGNGTVTVLPQDTSPTALVPPMSPEPKFENTTVLDFSASLSTGYDQPLTFFWNFGDGTNSTSENQSHVFVANGTYLVNLTVTDSDGSEAQLQQTVTIDDLGPSADIVGDTQIFEGDFATFNASGSASNPDTIAEYQWFISSDGLNFALANITTIPVLTKQFNSNGTFNIVVSVIDSDGSVDSDQLNLTVLDKGPTAVLSGDTVVFENQTAFFSASGSISSPDTVSSYQWDFNYNGTFVPAVNVSGPTVNFTYPSPSTPTVAVKVTDSDGSANMTTLSVLVKPSDHDVSVDSVSHNKATSTVYLFGTVNVTANISNKGNFDENITVRLKEGTTVFNTTTRTIQRNTSSQVSFDWIPTTAGFHNLIVEILPVTGETNAVNNQKILENVQVFSVKNNVDLSFVNPTMYPGPNASTNSQFYVWARVANNLSTDFKDFPVTLSTDSLTVNITQDNNQSTVKTFTTLSGTRTHWWYLDSGSNTTTKNIVLTIGNGADSVTINRTVSVV